MAVLEGFHGLESTHLADAARRGLNPADAAADLAHARNQGARIATPAQEQAVHQALGRPLRPNEPLGDLAGIGLPLRDPSVVFGTGHTAQRIAGGLDSIADKLKYGNAVGRWANGLFDPNVNEAVRGATQRASPAWPSGPRRGPGERTRRDLSGDLRDRCRDQGWAPGRTSAQGGPTAGRGRRVAGASNEVSNAARPIANVVRQSGDNRLSEATRWDSPWRMRPTPS